MAGTAAALYQQGPRRAGLNRQDARHGGYHEDRRPLTARFPTIADYVPTNCTLTIQQQAPGELKTLLAELEQAVQTLMPQLPPDQQAEATKDWEMMVKEATSATPSRRWYSVSADGLLEASKFVQDFTGNLTGTVGKLRNLLWPES